MTFSAHNTVAVVVEQPAFLKNAGDTVRRFLIVEEVANGQVVFNQPAGHLDAGETLPQAAVREALEETAWNVELRGFIGLYQYLAPENAQCYLRCCFAAAAINHEAHRALDPDIIRTHWFSIEDLQQRQAQLRSPAVLQVINDYLAGQTYPLTLVQTV